MAILPEEIKEIEAAMAEAFNRQDLTKVLGFFEPKMVGFSSTTHDRIQGTADLKKTFEYYLQEGERVEYEIKDVMVQDFGETAVASFHWTVTIDDGRTVHDIPGRGTHVFHKQKGKWLIVHEHFSRAHHHS